MIGVKHCISLVLFFVAFNLSANEEEVRVIGLFNNAAMIDYAGKQKIYRAGQKISSNVVLIKANTRFATLLFNGKKLELGLQKVASLGVNLPGSAEKSLPSEKAATIYQNNSGMFRTPGFINGISVAFLVDTGASQVAMNESIAKKIGLLYKSGGKQVSVATAAGIVPAWETKLKKVRVDGIELSNIEALVIKGAGPGEVLLGMSFLSKVKMERAGRLMKLVQRY